MSAIPRDVHIISDFNGKPLAQFLMTLGGPGNYDVNIAHSTKFINPSHPTRYDLAESAVGEHLTISLLNASGVALNMRTCISKAMPQWASS